MNHPHQPSRQDTFRSLLGAGLLAGLLLAGAASAAENRVRSDLHNAPALPRHLFVEPPTVRSFPGESMVVVNDSRVAAFDCFRYQGFYWAFRDGFWYRAPSWRGPFAAYDPRRVPAVFYLMPADRWKHRPGGVPAQFAGSLLPTGP